MILLLGFRFRRICEAEEHEEGCGSDGDSAETRQSGHKTGTGAEADDGRQQSEADEQHEREASASGTDPPDDRAEHSAACDDGDDEGEFVVSAEDSDRGLDERGGHQRDEGLADEQRWS